MQTVAIIGSGNVAWHLAKVLSEQKAVSLEIYCREPGQVNGFEQFVADLQPLSEAAKSKAEFVVVAVTDDVIKNVLSNINTSAMVCHTSGAVGLDIFEDKFSNCGIIWPLQSLTKGKETDLSKVPLFVEGNNSSSEKKLIAFAETVSHTVIPLKSEQRKYVHLAAVFANNFTNQMLDISYELLQSQNVDFKVLKPILEDSIKKAFDSSPSATQTGPARRNDQSTIQAQLDLLKDKPEYRELYELITGIITRKYSN